MQHVDSSERLFLDHPTRQRAAPLCSLHGRALIHSTLTLNCSGSLSGVGPQPLSFTHTLFSAKAAPPPSAGMAVEANQQEDPPSGIGIGGSPSFAYGSREARETVHHLRAQEQ
jgi:hypothetical protein